MISLQNDYSEGAHPQILKRLAEINLEQNPGYCSDTYCAGAAEKIRKACACPEAEVFFLVGGTQTNQVVIDTMLAPYEGVVAARTGHVSTHEAGAIEFTGHKVLELPQHEGKIQVAELRELVSGFWQDGNHEHMVFPGMVYISHPTEYGTLYSKEELEAISQTCREYKMPLYMDGARLAYGLTAPGTDVTLQDIARLCDVFYIGGTKCGAFFGEAVVFTKNNMPARFLTRVKQHGALLAKGHMLGIQFDTLFTDNLYYEIGAHAIRLAQIMQQGFLDAGLQLCVNSPTNQQFVELPDAVLPKLDEKGVVYRFWEKKSPDKTVVRFVTSWASKEETVRELVRILKEVL
ncbi:MAG: low specificity L-threonine aldolase [Acidaminococcaceae bacterium]|nr:low specificity L-threonine aldolase [Acidaminococcaceae bacterium]MBP5737123.1 low specificity L-threonine aldolase [Acidaminococcaceae bacterium]MBQ3366498.1 low specificity L-threonine aldolase [Acidaminococcaceae bacterium]MBQ6912671.1 low specificity L-threonine aldolase [Acidaminococcaceae bacterium]